MGRHPVTLTDPLSLDPLPRCGFTHGDWCMGERGRPGHTHRTDCPERVAPVLRWREGIDCERVGGES